MVADTRILGAEAHDDVGRRIDACVVDDEHFEVDGLAFEYLNDASNRCADGIRLVARRDDDRE